MIPTVTRKLLCISSSFHFTGQLALISGRILILSSFCL